ncbi:LysR family transcriptional regulator [Marinobacter sp. 1_MG-2023]|uniref:LysR family transcriptional regulator n=1 Tax=Marinobacter sp. 1_MG-2023 TaxID=3062627 RepID=UPI0026E3C79D|nr:LysR family transcriptional regulator [Marinobacter sp. 1_MG-2023]MDO6822759.1 LysR family transcriptional regulator [Marinobacter sp. 1_MG-2023]
MATKYDLTDFRLFIKIAESESMSRGAEQSHMSVPAASNRIRNLEDQLGLRLLQRNSQGVKVTNEGRVYLHHARKITSQLEVLTGDLQEFALGITGQLRLLANTTAITELLPNILGDYLQSHPSVHIEMKEKTSEEIVRTVKEGGADLGIVSGNIVTAGLQTLPFAESRLIIICPKGHPISKRDSISFEECLCYPLISLLEGSAIHQFLMKEAEKLHITLNIRVQVASYDAIYRMVVANLGIAIVSELGFARHKGTKNIKQVKLTDHWAERNFQLCAEDFDTLPTFAREFCDDLRALNR